MLSRKIIVRKVILQITNKFFEVKTSLGALSKNYNDNYADDDGDFA